MLMKAFEAALIARTTRVSYQSAHEILELLDLIISFYLIHRLFIASDLTMSLIDLNFQSY